MLDATVTADLVLVSSGVKKSNIKRFGTISFFREEHFVDMFFRIVIVMAVTRDASQHHPLVFFIPFIDRQHQKLFTNAPGIGQCSDERRIDHVPGLAVVLGFFADHAVNMRHALSHRVAAKLRIDIRHRHLDFYRPP